MNLGVRDSGARTTGVLRGDFSSLLDKFDRPGQLQPQRAGEQRLDANAHRLLALSTRQLRARSWSRSTPNDKGHPRPFEGPILLKCLN